MTDGMAYEKNFFFIVCEHHLPRDHLTVFELSMSTALIADNKNIYDLTSV
jgi:hypothetical protein